MPSAREMSTLLRVGRQADAPDGDLLDRFLRSRDDAAFAALIERHGPMVWGACRRILNDHHEAEDAFQATFLVLARRADAVRGCETIGPWLHGVALRTGRKARAALLRRRTREASLVREPEAGLLPRSTDPDLDAILDQELARLPDRFRLPLILCDLQGATRREAARLLGWREGTVASRLARGRGLLADRLRRRGCSPDSDRPACLGPIVPPALKAATLVKIGQAGHAGLLAGILGSWIGSASPFTATKFAISPSSVLVVGLVGTSLVAFGHAFGRFSDRAAESPPQAPAREPGPGPAPASIREGLDSAMDLTSRAISDLTDPDGRVWAWCALANLRRRGGSVEALDATLDAAVRAAEESESDHRRIDVAETLAEAGRVSQADALVASARIPSEMERGRSRIASGQARSGDIDGALRTAATIRADDLKGDALAAIAEHQEAPRALETAATIADPFDRARAFASIAERQARAKDPAAGSTLLRARDAAGRILHDQSNVLAEIAGVLSTMGDFDAARRQASEIEGGPIRDRAGRNIVAGLVEADRTDEAIRELQSIRSQGERDEARAEIVSALAGRDRPDEAARQADAIQSAPEKLKASISIVAAQARRGGRESASARFARLHGQIKGLTARGPAPNERTALAYRLAEAQARAGDQDAARGWIAAEPTADIRAWAWLGLSEGLAKSLPARVPLIVADRPGRQPERTYVTALAPVRKAGGPIRGKLILFGVSRFGRPDVSAIETIDVDGENPETILVLPENESIEAGRVSPDGLRVAFTATSKPGRAAPAELRIREADGSIRTLASGAFVMAWSPDGSRIAAIRPTQDRENDSLLIEVDSGRIARLPLPPADVIDDWSPDGARLSIMAGNPGARFEHPTKGSYPLRQVDLAMPDGTERIRASGGPGLDSIWSRFSPDGKSLAYSERRHRDGQVLHFAVLLDVATHQPRDLANFTEIYRGNRHYGPQGFPAWSPDGSAVAWITLRKKVQSSDYRPELMIVTIATGQVARLDLARQGIRWVQALDWR